MLPCLKIATVSATHSSAVSTAASLSEMRSSTSVSAISGMRARYAKHPGRSQPITGPLRQRLLHSDRHSGHSPHGNFARAATRSPTFTRVTPRADFEHLGAELVAE
jgi:hypothetical protein